MNSKLFLVCASHLRHNSPRKTDSSSTQQRDCFPQTGCASLQFCLPVENYQRNTSTEWVPELLSRFGEELMFLSWLNQETMLLVYILASIIFSKSSKVSSVFKESLSREEKSKHLKGQL